MITPVKQPTESRYTHEKRTQSLIQCKFGIIIIIIFFCGLMYRKKFETFERKIIPVIYDIIICFPIQREMFVP